MKQFARNFSLFAAVLASGVSLNTQAEDFDLGSLKNQVEVHMIRLKAEALVSVEYEIRESLKAPKAFYLGVVAKPNATKMKLAQRGDTLNNLETTAD